MNALHRAIELIGSQQKVAGLCDVSQPTVAGWVRRSFVPADYCIRLEQGTDRQVTCEDLRPDVDWAYLRTTVAQMPQSATGPTPIAQEASHGA